MSEGDDSKSKDESVKKDMKSRPNSLRSRRPQSAPGGRKSLQNNKQNSPADLGIIFFILFQCVFRSGAPI